MIENANSLEATLAYTCVLWQLSLDKELIDFGSYVVGQTTSRIITLTNVGGLGTKFKFLQDSQFYEMEEAQPIMKIVSAPAASDQQPQPPWVSVILLSQGWGGSLPSHIYNPICVQTCEQLRVSANQGGRGKCQDSLTCSLASGAKAAEWGPIKSCSLY